MDESENAKNQKEKERELNIQHVVHSIALVHVTISPRYLKSMSKIKERGTADLLLI